ncbi:DNA-binding protein [Massilia sp.]|uniref:DNA-binding protein n=1 Tax=Massilia sp. TaxID=1882437 RepID=UPI0028B21081|nr:DNA-binding protein [Massilia sp.]
MMTIEENLVGRFGPLMPLAGLADILNRSPEAVRMYLRSNGEFAQQINMAKLKIGRRLYFRTTEVARLLDGGSSLQN